MLVTTLHVRLSEADSLLRRGRAGAARGVYEEVLERAQERADGVMEVMARSMLARCLMRLRDVEGARDQLEAAGRRLDEGHVVSFARYREAQARLAIHDGPAQRALDELRDYLRWAEDMDVPESVLDACVLLGDHSDSEERVSWLGRGIEHVVARGETSGLGGAYNRLGAALDHLGRSDEALEAYQGALSIHRMGDDGRSRAAAAWAVGVLACRVEDWPLARARLEEALGVAESDDRCADLVALVLGDLSRVYEAAGDVVEARRLILRALRLGREQHLGDFAPARWQGLLAIAQQLDLDV